MSLWLDETRKLITNSGIDIQRIPCRIIIAIFYDHLSNRNLAMLVSSIYDVDENDVYFEIDKIVSNLSVEDIAEIKKVQIILDKHGFKDWADSEDF